MARSPEYPDIEFVPPRSFTAGRKRGMPRVVVIHYTAGHEGPTAAEDGAAYDGRRTDGTSAHYYHDSNSTVQCVLTTDEAHTARARGNDVGIHHELAGTKQTRAQWLDPVSDATITNAARQAARDARKYGIPVRRLSVSELRQAHPDFGDLNIRGFAGHNDVTRAYPEDRGDHLDPGEEFPWDIFFQRVRQFMNGDSTMADPAGLTTTHWRVWAIAQLLESIDNGVNNPHEAVPLSVAIREIRAGVTALADAVAKLTPAPAPVPGTVDLAALAAAVVDEIHARTAP